jgi:hypothetical protein
VSYKREYSIPRSERDAVLEKREERPSDSARAPGKVTLTGSLSGRIFRYATRGSIAPAALQYLVAAASQSGQPLPDALRRRLERALGADLRNVRIHTAPDAARAIAAQAYTIGRNIYFDEGAYDPNSKEGQRLIAHEVVHTVQDPTAGVPSGEIDVSCPTDRAERQADDFADAFAATEGSAPPATADVEMSVATPIARAPISGIPVPVSPLAPTGRIHRAAAATPRAAPRTGPNETPALVPNDMAGALLFNRGRNLPPLVWQKIAMSWAPVAPASMRQ